MPMPKIQWTEDMDRALQDNWHRPLSVIGDIVGVSRWGMRRRINELNLPQRNLAEVRRLARAEYEGFM